jgi:large subunit ribosomal protein L25
MERVKLVAHSRSEQGTRAAKRLRKQGVIPAVLYGSGEPAVAIGIRDHDLREALETPAGMHAVIDITVDEQKKARVVVVKDYQLDGVRSVITHVDFQEVKLDEPIEADVAVTYEGTPVGVKMMGGILDILMREITVSALPTEIPQHLSFDVSALEMGDAAHVSDLFVPEGVTVLADPDETLCTILAPRKATEEEAEAEAAEAAEAAGEPQVVGETSEEEEGE